MHIQSPRCLTPAPLEEAGGVSGMGVGAGDTYRRSRNINGSPFKALLHTCIHFPSHEDALIYMLPQPPEQMLEGAGV